MLGAVVIAQYFFGFDLRGRDVGNVVFLVLGSLVTGYGVFGFITFDWMRKKTAVKLGLPESSSWEEIKLVMRERKNRI